MKVGGGSAIRPPQNHTPGTLEKKKPKLESRNSAKGRNTCRSEPSNQLPSSSSSAYIKPPRKTWMVALEHLRANTAVLLSLRLHSSPSELLVLGSTAWLPLTGRAARTRPTSSFTA